MKITIRPIKTTLGDEYRLIISKWFGLKKIICGTYFTYDFAAIAARKLARDTGIKYSI